MLPRSICPCFCSRSIPLFIDAETVTVVVPLQLCTQLASQLQKLAITSTSTSSVYTYTLCGYRSILVFMYLCMYIVYMYIYIMYYVAIIASYQQKQLYNYILYYIHIVYIVDSSQYQYQYIIASSQQYCLARYLVLPLLLLLLLYIYIYIYIAISIDRYIEITTVIVIATRSVLKYYITLLSRQDEGTEHIYYIYNIYIYTVGGAAGYI